MHTLKLITTFLECICVTKLKFEVTSCDVKHYVAFPKHCHLAKYYNIAHEAVPSFLTKENFVRIKIISY